MKTPMNNIKFRAWCFQDKTMYYNAQNGLRLKDGTILGFQNIIRSLGYHKFKVMNYTGYKDVNDKEIYEGDIFLPSKPKSMLVVFSSEEFYHLCSIYGETDLYGIGIESPHLGEVLGNIYENKELLTSQGFNLLDDEEREEWGLNG